MATIRLLSVPGLISILLLFACQSVETGVFEGNEEAVAKAESMYKALGGKEKWAGIKSVYIRAYNKEPQLDDPYLSQIWRDLEDFKVRIEQKSEGAHRIGLFSDKGGWIQFVMHDTTRKLTTNELEGWRFQHRHDVYYQLHQLARYGCKDLRLGTEGRVEFYDPNGALRIAFLLDGQNRPSRFYVTNQTGLAESATAFTEWTTSHGMSHPVKGGPVDGSYSFSMEKWEPSKHGLDKAFDINYSLENK